MALQIHRVEIPVPQGKSEASARFRGAALSGDVLASVISSSAGDVQCVYAAGNAQQITPGETEHVLQHGQIELQVTVKLVKPASKEGAVTVAVCSSAEMLEPASG